MIHDDQIPSEPPVGTTLLWRSRDGEIAVTTHHDSGWRGYFSGAWSAVIQNVFVRAVGPVRAIRTDLLLERTGPGDDLGNDVVPYTTITLLPHVEPDTRPEPPDVVIDSHDCKWLRQSDGTYTWTSITLSLADLADKHGPLIVPLDPADYRDGPR